MIKPACLYPPPWGLSGARDKHQHSSFFLLLNRDTLQSRDNSIPQVESSTMRQLSNFSFGITYLESVDL